MKNLTLIPLLFLAGCASPDQLAENQRLQQQDDIATCRSYGLRMGSEAFGNCRLQLDLARQRPYYDDRPHFHTGFGYYHYR